MIKPIGQYQCHCYGVLIVNFEYVSKYIKFSEKVTFRTPIQAHGHMRIREKKFSFSKYLLTYQKVGL